MFSFAHKGRLPAVLAGLLIAASSLCSAAQATPTIVLFKTEALPIPGYPGTGDLLGAGAVIRGEGAISGSEYGGSPAPLVGAKIYTPPGMQVHPQGFVTCAPSLLEQSGPAVCPSRSIAGPKGSASGVVSFGGERVGETASVQLFFGPGGGLSAFVDGTTPVSLEIVARARLVGSAPPPFGLEFIGEVPLIETVPGALDASFIRGSVTVGAAYRQGKHTISYLTLPKTCSKGGWPVKIELDFLGGAVAEASYTMPCPKKR
ncbi:MAG TPA: hypothetical protein VMG80_06625 [Solirubrobacteraceae bacterium]|nr:hypothetical protein [Solirubrobacteraceae bacterium]